MNVREGSFPFKHKYTHGTETKFEKKKEKRAQPPLIPKLVLNQIACVEYCLSE